METHLIEPGDLLPDLEGRTLDGSPVRYRDLWQKKAAVVVTFGSLAHRGTAAYLEELSRHSSDFRLYDATLILRDARVTLGPSDGASASPADLPIPSVIIADRWGEVRYVGRLADHHLPAVDEVIEWLRFVQMECPECQGETK